MFLKLLICSRYIFGFNGQSFTWSNFELTDFWTQKETKRGHRASNWDARVVRKVKRVQNVPEKEVALRNIVLTKESRFLSFPSLTSWVCISSLSLLKYRNKHIYVYVCVCVCVCMYICTILWKNLNELFANSILINIYIYKHKFIHTWLDSNLFYIWFILCMKIKDMIMSKSYIFKLKY